MKLFFKLLAFVLLVCSFTPDKKELDTAVEMLAKTLNSKEIVLQKDGDYFIINNKGKSVGKLFFRKLTPKAETFTYFLAIDNEGKIIKLQITDYPSQHGVRITSRNWLDQFTNKAPASENFESSIDGVSGATLSVKALVKDIKEVTRP